MHRYLAFILASFFLSSCGGSSGGGSSSDDIVSFADSDSLVAADANSTYADVLVTCLAPEDDSSSCVLDGLPLIAQKGSPVTIDAVMEQTLVSHDWMAERFQEALAVLPDDLLQLFGATTGVVIAADIRPSFYTTQTGAINLDAAYFWLTNEEKAVIDQEDDFRSSFGDDLQFITLARYVQGDDYAWESYALDGDEERTLNDIIEPLAALLFHELAHANDFFPRSEISSLNTSNSVSVEASRFSSERISNDLVNFSPLESDLLTDLAGVLFLGDTATAELIAVSADEAGMEFAADVASDDYAYTNQYEDLAMLFEEIMMKYHFDIDRDIAYTDRPEDDSLFCVDYPVRWGQRGRIGDPSVLARTSYMLQRLLNQNDVSEYTSGLAMPVAMNAGDDWCENIVLSEPTAGILKASEPSAVFPLADKNHIAH